jgi:hypothetical protein
VGSNPATFLALTSTIPHLTVPLVLFDHDAPRPSFFQSLLYSGLLLNFGSLNLDLEMAEHIERCRQRAGELAYQAKVLHTRLGASNEPKIILYGAASLALFVWLLIRATHLLKEPQRSRPATPDLEKPAVRSFKAAQREPGGLLHI